MKKILTAAAILAALVAGPASAQTYLGIGAGSAKTDTDQTSWKVYGGFQFNPTWGLELGYTDLGKFRGSNVESVSLAGTGTMPLSDTLSLFGKLGATSNRTHFSGSSNNTELLAGLGVGYKFSKNMAIRLEYEDFGKVSNSGGINTNASNWGLSAKYSF